MKRVKLPFFGPILVMALCIASFPLGLSAQVEIEPIIPVRSILPEMIQSDEDLNFRTLPKCETEEWFKKKYERFDVEELIEELQTEDSVFMCYGVRYTQRPSSKRAVIRWFLAQKRDTAVPQLIQLVKTGEPEFCGMALELIQHSDRNLLKEHRELFLKKSLSEDIIIRNRSLYVLQRIKDEYIEQVMIERWNALSNKELEFYSNTGTLRIMTEMIVYGAKNRAAVEESILLTLREKRLTNAALTQYCNLIRSFVFQEHSTEIEAEIIKILQETKDVRVAYYAAEVLKDARTIEARNGLIRCLDIKKDSVRAEVAGRLVQRSDFDIIADQVLLQRLLSDESAHVVNLVSSYLSWKQPNAEQSAVIVQCVLNELSQSEKAVEQKVWLLGSYYGNLDETAREALTINNASAVLEAIETTLNSNQYRINFSKVTERIFQRLYGKKEMDVSPLEFWRLQLER